MGGGDETGFTKYFRVDMPNMHYVPDEEKLLTESCNEIISMVTTSAIVKDEDPAGGANYYHYGAFSFNAMHDNGYLSVIKISCAGIYVEGNWFNTPYDLAKIIMGDIFTEEQFNRAFSIVEINKEEFYKEVMN